MRNKIKILNITVRADFGGGPEHLYQLCKNISNKFEIFIAAPNDRPYWKRYSNLVGKSNLLEIPHRKFSIKKFFSIANFIFRNNISIVHSHGKGAGIYSRLLKIVCPKIKVIHTFHGLHIGKYNKLGVKLYLMLEKFLGILTTNFISVSNSEAEIILSKKFIQKQKLRVIENGVEISDSQNNHEEKFNSNRIVHVTRFDFQKNTELLLEIARELKKYSKLEKLKFIILGDGEGRTSFEKKLSDFNLSDRIEIVGAVNNVKSYFNKSKFIISTSRWEGLPLALLEAMSCGLPVIATNVTGNNDIVKDGYNGILFDANNFDSIISDFNELNVNKEKWIEYSNNSRKLIEEKYDVKLMAKKTSQIYESVLKG